MDEELLTSRRLQMLFQRLPNVSILSLKYNPVFWRYLVQIIRGEMTYPELPRKLGPLRHLIYRWGDWEIARHMKDVAEA
jgi:hypothetical protein